MNKALLFFLFCISINSLFGQEEDLYLMHDEFFLNNPVGLNYKQSNTPNMFVLDLRRAQQVDSIKRFYDPFYLQFVKIDSQVSQSELAKAKNTEWLSNYYAEFYDGFVQDKYWMSEDGRPKYFALYNLFRSVYVLRQVDGKWEKVKVRQVEKIED